MLRVLSHYFPLRTALLALSETLILWLILATGLSQHLWAAVSGASDPRFLGIGRELARSNLTPHDALWRCLVSALLLALLAQVAIGFNRLYEQRVAGSRYARAARFVESAGTALGLTVGALWLTSQWGLTQVLDFPGITLSQRTQALVFSLVGAFVVLYLWRILFQVLLQKLKLNQRVLVLGSRGPAHALAKEIMDHPGCGYEVMGLVPEPEPESLALTKSGPRRRMTGDNGERTPETDALVRDGLRILFRNHQNRGVAMGSAPKRNHEEPAESLLTFVRAKQVDLIVVALEDRRQRLPTEELLNCRLTGIEVREREELYEEVTGKLAVEAMRPSYLIFNEGFRRHPWAELAKRVSDVLLALLILFFCWPLMIASALMVRIDTPGPILFKQARIGRDGKPFTLVKFRTMRADAEKLTGPVWSSENDPRITRSGRLMRKTRLDELPQLFNVLAGSMSLVGPRPERQHFIDELARQIPYYHQRHIVKPGLTGWAQINYPYGNTVEDALNKLQYDLFYIKNQSLIFDLSILFTTIKTVILRQGT